MSQTRKRRLQLTLAEGVLEDWDAQAAQEGVPTSQWVTNRVNRPDCPLSLDHRMDRLIEVLEVLSLSLQK